MKVLKEVSKREQELNKKLAQDVIESYYKKQEREHNKNYFRSLMNSYQSNNQTVIKVIK